MREGVRGYIGRNGTPPLLRLVVDGGRRREGGLRLVIEPCVSAIAFPTLNYNILWEGRLRLVIGENAIFCTLFQML